MSSAKHRLDKLLKKARRLRRIDESAVRNIVATTRELIEATRSQSLYPVTTLYCNWSLHTDISASLTALRCLEQITLRIVPRSPRAAAAEELLEFLSNQAFQTSRLRNEMVELFQSKGLLGFIFSEDHNWQTFAALVFADLVGKRLQYPAGVELAPKPKDSEWMKSARRIYSRLSDAVGGVPRKMHRAAWISLTIDPWDERPEVDREPVFHSNVQTFDDVTFVIRINNLAPLPEADEYMLVVPD